MTINSKEKSDYYYLKAKIDGYRARSVYKLLDIDEKYKIFENTENVIDLCAAPGSWTQCMIKNFSHIKNIVAVDLQKIAKIDNTETNVVLLREDITSERCIEQINNVEIPFDTLICDGAPDVTGLNEFDEYLQVDILKACLKIISSIKKSNKTQFKFVSKVFRGSFTSPLISHFRKFFADVLITKPRSSRSNSRECFIVCKTLLHNIEDDPCVIDFSDTSQSYRCESCGFGPDPDYKDNKIKSSNIKSKPIEPPYEESLLNKGKNN